jgi:hypothetical protein
MFNASKTTLTPLKWDVCITPESRQSVSAAAMTDPDPNPFAHCDVMVAPTRLTSTSPQGLH